jgi:hypothetical protein
VVRAVDVLEARKAVMVTFDIAMRITRVIWPPIQRVPGCPTG